MSEKRKTVVIIGGGFAGLNAARRLGKSGKLDVHLIDRSNHHLFQPLLYQVAMAGLSPAQIAAPIRSLVSKHRCVDVTIGSVQEIDLQTRSVSGDFGQLSYDYLLVATGSRHSYFGKPAWEQYAPGLKTLAQATEIRRRVLTAFELAEREQDPQQRRAWLTFVVVGGGPTGVELAGAIGEMSRFTLARDFRHIDPKLTRVILIEAGPRILASFSEVLASRAARDLEGLGVQIWTNSLVTQVNESGVEVGDEKVQARTVLWAAGVQASALGSLLSQDTDRSGRVRVGNDLSLPDHPEVFVAGDLAHFQGPSGKALPGLAPVAMQQGRFVGGAILRELAGKPRGAFEYQDKGQMATIGRSRAICEVGKFRLTGFVAWLAWLLIHIYYLSGFQNRLLVLMQWAWSYVTFARGARLIVAKDWHEPPTTPPTK